MGMQQGQSKVKPIQKEEGLESKGVSLNAQKGELTEGGKNTVCLAIYRFVCYRMHELGRKEDAPN